MSSTSVAQLENTERNRAGSTPWNSALLLRFVLAAIAVLICYCFHWHWLRFLTSEANLRVDALLGLQMQRLSSDTILWNGMLYKYENACTFADVWCAAIPLIWNLRKSFTSNLSLLAWFTPVLFVFNIFRLSASDFFFSTGIPWMWAHEFVGGCAYFLVWVGIWRNRSW